MVGLADACGAPNQDDHDAALLLLKPISKIINTSEFKGELA